MEEETDRRDTMLNQGLAHLQQALDAPTPERAQERLQGARAVASNLGRMEGGDENRHKLAMHGNRVRNILSNRDMLASADDADQLAECAYCKVLRLSNSESGSPGVQLGQLQVPRAPGRRPFSGADRRPRHLTDDGVNSESDLLTSQHKTGG